MWIFSFPNNIHWREFPFLSIFLTPLVKISWPNMHDFISGISMLLHGVTCLLHSSIILFKLLNIIVYYYYRYWTQEVCYLQLYSLFFFFLSKKFFFPVSGLLEFHINFRIIFSASMENANGIFRGTGIVSF